MSELGEGDCAFQTWICPKCHDDHSQSARCKTIDLWESYSNLTHYREQMEQDKPELNRRIKVLIELIREKDEALEYARVLLDRHIGPVTDNKHNCPILKALALTKELK